MGRRVGRDAGAEVEGCSFLGREMRQAPVSRMGSEPHATQCTGACLSLLWRVLDVLYRTSNCIGTIAHQVNDETSGAQQC